MLRLGLLAAFVACTAAASPIVVTIAGTYPTDVVGSAAPFGAADFLLRFTTDTTPTTFLGPGPGYWIDITATYTSGSVNRTLNGIAGYYSFGFGQGVDVRISNFDVAGDLLQTLARMPNGIYTGTPQNPTLALLSSSSNGSAVNYYPDPGTSLPHDGLNVTYTAETVPEPGTVCLLLAPLAGIVGFGRRRVRMPGGSAYCMRSAK
jgi:hypothetical protein